jgi:transcriptional regulator with XRE-family HTH domain
MDDPREVVRCLSCLLVQFRTQSGNCRKCRKSLDPHEPEPEEETFIDEPIPQLLLSLQVHERVLHFREVRGLTQKQLAVKMGDLPRTYISKIEGRRAIPTLSSLERFAEALGVEVWQLLLSGREEAEAAVAADSFLAEMAELSATLDPRMRDFIVLEAQRLALANQGYR